jgi:hypothetical protein
VNSTEEGKIRNFKDLKIWQRGVELVKLIYVITNSFSVDEKYGLVLRFANTVTYAIQ